MIPVFVPSYRRPDAKFLRRSMNQKFPLYVFVRKEEKEAYSWIKARPNTTLVLISNVSNIGETRRVMFNYAVHKGFDKIIMLDDDVTRLDLSMVDPKSGKVKASGNVIGHVEDWRKVLLRWEAIWTDEAMLGASYRPFSWSLTEDEISILRRSQLQQAIGINVKVIHKAGLNYQSNDLVGNEDLFLQLECYQKGLECVKTNEIQYDCPAMGAGTGGCNASELGSIQQKQHKRVAQFVLACKDPTLIKIAKTRSGVESIKFNWKAIKFIMEG